MPSNTSWEPPKGAAAKAAVCVKPCSSANSKMLRLKKLGRKMWSHSSSSCRKTQQRSLVGRYASPGLTTEDGGGDATVPLSRWYKKGMSLGDLGVGGARIPCPARANKKRMQGIVNTSRNLRANKNRVAYTVGVSEKRIAYTAGVKKKKKDILTVRRTLLDLLFE